jgi:hypothetical protein
MMRWLRGKYSTWMFSAFLSSAFTAILFLMQKPRRGRRLWIIDYLLLQSNFSGSTYRCWRYWSSYASTGIHETRQTTTVYQSTIFKCAKIITVQISPLFGKLAGLGSFLFLGWDWWNVWWKVGCRRHYGSDASCLKLSSNFHPFIILALKNRAPLVLSQH